MEATLYGTRRVRVREAAEYLGIAPATLRDRGWRRRHGIPTLRVGRAVVFDIEALDAWLRRHTERRPPEAASSEGDGGDR